MRLIDADAFLERTSKDPLFPLLERYGLSGVIENEPTVEAIPISFIKLQKDVLRSLLEYSDYHYEKGSNREIFALSKKHEALEELLKDWSEHESEA